jgi:glycosyltransferase involved in cell wall biosynthesis
VRPRVSILLPAYQAAGTLDSCLESIRCQCETQWECLVVDDGSRDGTLAGARRFAAEDDRFRVLSTPHAGLVAALTTGLRHCRAPVVARMDADDLMHPGRLAAQLELLDRCPDLAAVGCHVRFFPRAGMSEGLRAYERWLNAIDCSRRVREEAFVECPLAHPTLTLRTEVLRTLGYRDVEWPEDYDLVLRLLANGHEVGVVPRPLHAWRDGPTRLSRADRRYGLERFTACKAAFLSAGFLRHTSTYVLWGYGATGRALRRALVRHGKRPSLVVEVHPGRIGQTIHGAPVIAVEELLERPRLPVVASIAGAVPRRAVREALGRIGLRETHDFVCAA